jgi:hypothetical protein
VPNQPACGASPTWANKNTARIWNDVSCVIYWLAPLPPTFKTLGIYYTLMIFLIFCFQDHGNLIRIGFSSKLLQELFQLIEYRPHTESQTFWKMRCKTFVKNWTPIIFTAFLHRDCLLEELWRENSWWKQLFPWGICMPPVGLYEKSLIILVFAYGL